MERATRDGARPASATVRALDRAVRGLRKGQRPDGAWHSDPDMGPVGLALTVLTEHWFGVLRPADARLFASALRRAQLKDGGFEIHPHAGRGTLGATATCRAALEVCGVGRNDDAVQRAEARIRMLGGWEAVSRRFLSHGEPAAMFAAMAGLVPGEALPPLSPDMAALPWSERMLDGRLHGGVPIVLYACAAVRERTTRRSGLVPNVLRGAARALARARLTGYLAQLQNPSGSWNEMVFSTAFSLLALEGVGHDASSPMVRRGLDWIDSRKRRTQRGVAVSVFDGEMWETAFVIDALVASGVSPNDDAVRAGVAYLEAGQCREPQARMNQPNAAAPRTGGFAYQRDNQAMPDCDDTGVVVAALGAAGHRTASPSVAKAVAWLQGMQNPSGGFGSYVHGLPDKAPGRPLYADPPPNLSDVKTIVETILRPPPELGDPAVADLTGRVLWGLGACGLGVDEPMVRRAVSFLERDACPDGSWFGLWNPAYVSGTAFALLGLASVGADCGAPFVERAVHWLLAKQNRDGGWGETPASFVDPALAGAAPSMPPLTGIVLRAFAELAARGALAPAARAAAKRAERYLVETQLDDGSWPDNGYLFTIIPPTFYTWGWQRYYYPLFGLGRWQRVAASRPRGAKSRPIGQRARARS